MTQKPDAVEIRDNRQLMKERSREVCRVCSSPDVHVDHYGKPTVKCIGYLRDAYNRNTAELDALRREVEAGKARQAEADSIIVLLGKYYPLTDDAISFELMEYVRKYPDVVPTKSTENVDAIATEEQND